MFFSFLSLFIFALPPSLFNPLSHGATEVEMDPYLSLVPPPRQLTLERQLNKSILIRWNHPECSPDSARFPESYHVYVDGNLRNTVSVNDRPSALVEHVDSFRVSVSGVLYT